MAKSSTLRDVATAFLRLPIILAVPLTAFVSGCGSSIQYRVAPVDKMKCCRRSLAAIALLIGATNSSAQRVDSGPIRRPDSTERCVASDTSRCDSGFIKVSWPKAIPGSCGRPSVLRELLRPGDIGFTELVILVGELGQVVESRITTSSGNLALDEALVSASRSCKFVPGSRGGAPAALATVWVERWNRASTAPTTITAVIPVPPAPTAAAMTLRDLCSKQAMPYYPRTALLKGITGVVTVKARIADGAVVEILEYTGDEVFRASIQASLSQYECAKTDAPVAATQSFTFNLESVAPAAASSP